MDESEIRGGWGYADGSDADVGDFLSGGAGADRLVVGGDDYATGGEDADQFIIGDWLDETHSAVIEDYDAAEDQIAVVYDPEVTADPVVGLEASDTENAQWVTLNGVRIAEVLDAAGLTLEDIALVASSAINLAA